jgi:hypothetical protein
MTLTTDRKRHLLKRFHGCYQHTYPNGVTVHIRDHQQDLAHKPAEIETVQDYVHKHIQRHVREVLEDQSKGVIHYYGLLDRGGNLAKRLFTSHKRNRVPPAEEREDGKLSIPSNGLLPDDFDNIVANKRMANCEIKPLFYRALIAEYDPPPAKFVILDGAPMQPMTKEEARVLGPAAFNKVYGVRTGHVELNNVQMSSRDVLNTPMGPAKPVTERFQCPPEIYTHNIPESDLSAFFHAHKHVRHPGSPLTAPDQVIVIDGNDADYLFIALLGCGDRIDRHTSKFNSRIWIKLRGHPAAKAAAKKRKTKADADKKKRQEQGEDADDGDEEDNPIDGRDIYININKLYLMMDQDPDLSEAQFPVGMGVLLYILGGTDFFDDFLGDDNSIFHGMGWETCVWDTWCNHKSRFANLIMLFYTGPAGYNQPDLCRRPYIDEDAMVTFFHQCYAVKYGKAVRELYDVEQVTPDQLREYTRGFAHNCKRKANEDDAKFEKRHLMARKKAMPEDPILRRYARLALLNWTYWLNGYRPGGDAFCDPLELHEGLPYYGYVQDPDNPHAYSLSPVVSPPKPIPDYVVPYMDKHNAATREEAEGARQAALEQLERENEMAKEMAREEERLERQRKLVEKQKRIAAQEKKRAATAAGGGGGGGSVALAYRANPPSVKPVIKPAPTVVTQSRLTHTAQLATTSGAGKGIKRAPPPLQRE